MIKKTKLFVVAPLVALCAGMSVADDTPMPGDEHPVQVQSTTGGQRYSLTEYTLSEPELAQLKRTVALSGGDLITIEKTIAGPRGMIGLILRIPVKDDNPQRIVAWSLSVDGPLIFGNVIDGGDDYTQLMIEKYITRQMPQPQALPEYKQNDSVMTMLSGLDPENYVSQKPRVRAVKTIYVLFDAQCPHCHRFFREMYSRRDELSRKGIRVNWIPVNLLGGESIEYGAAILDGGFKKLIEINVEDSLPSAENPASLQSKIAVMNNTEIIRSGLVEPGVPSIHWIDGKGEHHSVTGEMTSEQIADMING